MIPERIIVLNPVSSKGPHTAIPYDDGGCMDDDTVTVEQYEAINTMPNPQFTALLLTLLNAGWSLSCSIYQVLGDQYEARIRVEQRGTTAAFRSTSRQETPGHALYTALVMIFTYITDREKSLSR